MATRVEQRKQVERNKRYLFLGVEGAGVVLTAVSSPVLGVPVMAAGAYLGWKWFQFRARNGMRF
ncbi:MAG: hypothetical protein AAF310_00510 [Myxococcota bacterium]